MQYKVPQNVDIEDKVIAGLTLKQFIYLIVAGGIVLMLKYALPASLQFLFMPLALIIGAVGAALAFIKINDRPMESFVLSAAKTVITPNQRTWQKEGLQIDEKPIDKKPKDDFQKKESVEEIRSNLERLAMIVDSGAHGLAEDRSTNVKPTNTEPPSSKVSDLLAATEKPSEKLDKFIQNAKKTVAGQNKEKPISSLATVNQSESNFKYEQIETKSEKELEDIIKQAREGEDKERAKLDSAKIEKF